MLLQSNVFLIRFLLLSYIQGCLLTATFSVIVNCQPILVQGERRVLQGDPSFLFLFTYVADVLARIISRKIENGNIGGVRIGIE